MDPWWLLQWTGGWPYKVLSNMGGVFVGYRMLLKWKFYTVPDHETGHPTITLHFVMKSPY
jgi:hypothetical protein